MKIELDLPFGEDELRAALEQANKGKSDPLRALCRKEVARFERAAQQHPAYQDGLVQIEKRAVEGYLYQKLRNHIDSSVHPEDLPSR